MLLLAAALGYAAWLGAAGRIPVGSDRSAYAGIQQVAATLRDQPDTTIIYHQSLGWYFDFYLFDAPQERRWYDTAAKLADDAAHTAETAPDRPQWLIATQGETAEVESLRPMLAMHDLALAETGAIARPDGSRSFVLYRLVPLASGGGQ